MSSITLSLSLRGRLLSGTQTTLQGALFGNGEPGFTFEPWDITTLYQDRAGTTPVTAAGQSVGLRLDKSQGLRQGPELFTTFTSVGAGWVDNGNGSWTITNAASSSDLRVDFATSVLNKRYKIQYSVSGSVGSSIAYHFNTNPGSLTTGTFNSSLTVFATFFIVRASIGATITVSGVSMKEIAGNHEVAVSDAKRGVYGWMPKTGRRNLLTYTEDLTNAVWSKSEVTVSANVTTDPLDAAADKVIPSITSSGKSWTHNLGFTSSGAWTFSRVVKNDGYNFYAIALQNSTLTAAFYNLTTGAITSVGANVTATSAVDLGGGWWRVSLTTAQAIGFVQEYVSATAGFSAMTGNGTSGVIIGGAQWEAGSTATAYQRVNSQYDITEAGVPTCYYVQADGVDDAYVTPTITPNTDKAQVFAGVRKTTGNNNAVIIETSVSSPANNGTLRLTANGGSIENYEFGLLGTAPAANFRASVVGSTTNVVTSLSDISVLSTSLSDQLKVRINGVSQTVAGASTTGGSNFLAYPAYIYGRAGTSLPFNGLDFGHAVRFGPNLDAATIARVEALIARNTPEVTL